MVELAAHVRRHLLAPIINASNNATKMLNPYRRLVLQTVMCCHFPPRRLAKILKQNARTVRDHSTAVGKALVVYRDPSDVPSVQSISCLTAASALATMWWCWCMAC